MSGFSVATPSGEALASEARPVGREPADDARPAGGGPSPEGTLLQRLLPAPVVAAEAFADVTEEGLGGAAEGLFAEERALITRAVDKRRREFTTARLCAHRALAQLGWPPQPLLRGGRGEPLWPAGVVGSLTHCRGYRGAAVARGGDIVTLGIDAEPVGPLPPGVVEHVALPEERTMLARLASDRTPGRAAGDEVPVESLDHLLFSAKESVYKAWYPLTGAWLGFGDVVVDLAADGVFAVRFLVPVPPAASALLRLEGRWQVTRGLILTSAVVTA